MKLAELATDDFQKRGDKYPSSGKPVAISVRGNCATLEFKNTSETEAKKWASNYLFNYGFTVESIEVNQEGDYHDDWVHVYANVKQPA